MLFFAALVADTYIYFGFIARRWRRPSLRLAYIAAAVLTDAAALSALAIYGSASDNGSRGVIAVMWLVWTFFLTLVPKILYSLGGVLDFLVRLVARRRSVVFRQLGLVLASVLMVVMVCGATIGRTRLRVEHVEVASPRVPPAFDGYRIVQFSDVHLGTMSRPVAHIVRLAEKISSLGADMVVNTGDLVNLTHDELSPQAMLAFGRIGARDGVWSVWGNHDLGFYMRKDSRFTPESNLAALEQKLFMMGWGMLSDRSVWIRRGGDSLLLTGLDYPHDRRLNSNNSTLAGVDIPAAYESVEGDPFNVVLAHTPRLWDDILASGRGDLTLSGHVHSMQTKLSVGDWRWSPAQYMYDRWSGKYTSGGDEKNRVLWVNDGIGCVGYPMRIGARGEITVITLKRCE